MRAAMRIGIGVLFTVAGLVGAPASGANAASDAPAIAFAIEARELSILKDHTKYVHSVAFSPDGRTIASGSGDKTIKLWDVASGRELRTLQAHTSGVSSVVFSPDGRTIASGSYDKTITLWDAASGRQLRTLKGHTSGVTSVAFSPDGRTIVSGSQDKTVKLWDAISGRELRTLKAHTGEVTSAVFSPDGRTIASGSHDDTIKLWDAASGQEVRMLQGHTSGVESVVFSPDGRTLASGSEDRTVKLWDAASGRELRTLHGHRSTVMSVVFSPDGRTLVSAASGSAINLWDAATGRQLQSLQGHTSGVASVVFSPNGRTLASASYDTTIRLWNIGVVASAPMASSTEAPPPASGAAIPADREGPAKIASPSPERRVALVIGNSAYRAAQLLPNPSHDADLIGAALRSSGIADVTILHDLDREGTVAALKAFARKADAADWAVIYYAGHGIEIGGTNYLIPVDAKLETDRDVADEAISLDRVQSAIEGAHKLKLIVLDACRNNPFAAQMKVTVANRSIGRGLSPVEPTGATLVVYAAKGGTSAEDGEGGDSPFALSFAKRIVEPGVEINKTLRFVRQDVLLTTGKQEPFVYGSLPPEDFYFVAPK